MREKYLATKKKMVYKYLIRIKKKRERDLNER